mgnify:FL=1
MLNNTNIVKPFKTGYANSGQLFSNIPNQFEPIRKDLWSLEFPVQMGIPEILEVSASRPKMTNASKEVMFKNLSFK